VLQVFLFKCFYFLSQCGAALSHLLFHLGSCLFEALIALSQKYWQVFNKAFNLLDCGLDLLFDINSVFSSAEDGKLLDGIMSIAELTHRVLNYLDRVDLLDEDVQLRWNLVQNIISLGQVLHESYRVSLKGGCNLSFYLLNHSPRNLRKLVVQWFKVKSNASEVDD
jgi:hypothetical protein